MNKKGFTLIEILSVIVLIGLLLGLGVPGIMKISENMKTRSNNTKVNLIEQAATLWGQDNKTRLQSDTCTINTEEYNCKKITVKELIENDYINSDEVGYDKSKSLIDNSVISNNYVYVYKKNNRVYAYMSGELATKLPRYTYSDSIFTFDNEEYEQYVAKENTFSYQVIDACKPDSTKWIPFDSNEETINSGSNIVFVKIEDSEGNKIIYVIHGFKVCTDKTKDANGWYKENVNIIIASPNEIRYSWDSPTYNEIYDTIKSDFSIKLNEETKSKKLYIKDGNTEKEPSEFKLDKNLPKIVDDNFSITPIEGTYNVVLSADIKDSLGISGYKFVEGTNCGGEGYTLVNNKEAPATATVSVDRDKTYTLCVKDYAGKISSKTKNIPKTDTIKPTIDNYKVIYNTSTASATLSATIKDEVNLAGYLFNTTNTCPTNLTSYTSITGTSQNISKNIGVTEGDYYLCVKDQKGNINKAGPVYVANCLFGGSYTCSHSTILGYNFNAKYHFYIELANSNPLKVQIETPGSKPEKDINFGSNYYDVTNTINGCDSDRDIRIHMYHNGVECYTQEINQTN